MIARAVGRPLAAAAAAALVNLALLGAAALLTRERPVDVTVAPPVPVSLLALPRAEEPPPERARPEPPPPEEPRPQLRPEPFLPSPSAAGPVPGPALSVDLGDLDLGGPPRNDFVFESGDLDHPPAILARVPPPYPYRARQMEVEGHVRVRFLVTPDGRAEHVEIIDAEPPGFFEDAVLQSVPTWTFRPGEVDGTPVASWMATTVRFQLKS